MCEDYFTVYKIKKSILFLTNVVKLNYGTENMLKNVEKKQHLKAICCF